MRAAAVAVFVIALAAIVSVPRSATSAAAPPPDGQAIFRFDTFGDEQLWTKVLRMHEVIESSLSPKLALSLGLKVDVDALPTEIIAALKAGQVNLNDPAVTVKLLELNAVVGVVGSVSPVGKLKSVGITCALCHSTVDNSFAPGIGRRLDGWANRDLDVGKIVATSPAIPAAVKTQFNAWGPGKYDPRHHIFDGKQIVILNPQSLPVVIPSIFGLQGIGFETFTGDGPISYWNAYVGVSQMGGQGDFSDPRIGVTIRQRPDLVTPKLPALLAYQLSLVSPRAPQPGSFNLEAARRGEALFNGVANCSSCHTPPLYTDVMSGSNPPLLHSPAAVGQDARYAQRSATKQYRTTPLRALWQHPPYFHDGSASDLNAVVDRYIKLFGLPLDTAQKADLVEFLKSL